MKPLKAIIWKEVRECLPLAALATLVLGLYWAQQIYGQLGPERSWESLWEKDFSVPFLLLCPLFAGGLALMQTMRELRRDQWAFLVHRPTSRGTIFGGKTLTGLGLYLGGCFLVLLLAALWISRPGRVFGPFFLGLLEPAVAGILSGVNFYFAGVLIAMRPARWYGSRVLPLVVAIFCHALMTSMETLAQAILVLAIGSVLLGVAAWGSFINGGELGRQPRASQISLGIVLGTSLFILDFMGISILVAEFARPRIQRLIQYVPGHGAEWLQIDYNRGASYVTRLDGTPVELEPGKTLDQQINLREGTQLELGKRTNPNILSYQRPQRFAYTFGTWSANMPRWFYCPREGYFRGYDASTRLQIGTIGITGFAPAGEPLPQPFPLHRLSSWYLEDFQVLSFPEGVYAIKLEERKVQRLLEAEGQEPIRGVGSKPVFSPETESVVHSAMVLRGGTVYMINADGRIEAKLPLPRNVNSYVLATFYTNTTRDLYHVLLRPPGNLKPGQPQLPNQALIYRRDGLLISNITLPVPLPRQGAEVGPTLGLLGLMTPPGALAAFLGMGLIGKWFGTTFWHELSKNPALSVIWIVCCCIGLVLSVFAAHRIARRCGLRPGAYQLWILATVILGPLGILTMLSLLAWPPQVPCPHCRRKRLVTQDKCEHCGAGWPARVPDGSEIFPEVAKSGAHALYVH